MTSRPRSNLSSNLCSCESEAHLKWLSLIRLDWAEVSLILNEAPLVLGVLNWANIARNEAKGLIQHATSRTLTRSLTHKNTLTLRKIINISKTDAHRLLLLLLHTQELAKIIITTFYPFRPADSSIRFFTCLFLCVCLFDTIFLSLSL